MIAHISMQTCD